MNTTEVITTAVKLSGLPGYAGTYQALGQGEGNETFLLDLAGSQVVLRVAKRKGSDILRNEATTLRLLQDAHTPQLIYFDEQQLIDERMWIIESYVAGKIVSRLNEAQFSSLGRLLATVHSIKGEGQLNLWEQFLHSCRSFGDEKYLLAHPDQHLKELILVAKQRMDQLQPNFSAVEMALIHGDATPSNILAKEDEVVLIDWEFSGYSDPMREFSTIYYEDMEFNQGKWRIQITEKEKQALFAGYAQAGGVIAEDRIAFWMSFDKLGAAIYLHWKLFVSGDVLPKAERQQNIFDLEQLVRSIHNH